MNTNNYIRRWSFEYIYMIIMVIYMSQMTATTSRLMGGLTGELVPLLIPILPTLYLFFKYDVRLNSSFIKLAVLFIIWLLAILIKYNSIGDLGFISFHLFILLSFFMAYVHVKVYGTSFADVYEDVVVKFALISLPLWALSLIPGADNYYRLLPNTGDMSTGSGTNLFYLYHWMDPLRATVENRMSIVRNSGMTWEPGRYSLILCFAIWNNLSNNGIQFKGNRNIWILIGALLTTFSTTGYVTVFLLYSIFYLKGFSLNNVVKLLLVIVPSFLFMMNLDFMGDKISEKANLKTETESFIDTEQYTSRTGGRESHASLDRFLSLSFEFENIKNDPVLGYSRNTENSWFGKTFSSDYSLSGGLLKTIGQYGLLLGLFFYALLIKSSRLLSLSKTYKRQYSLAIMVIVGSISYGLFGTVVFMTFWLYGAFGEVPDKQLI